jgi:hypothetical protein
MLLPLLVLAATPLFVSSAVLGRPRHETPSQRPITIRNQSGRRFDVFWINTFTDPVSYVSNSVENEGYPYGGDAVFLSYIGHEFEVREMPSKKTKSCRLKECAKAYFKVNDQEFQGRLYSNIG